MDKKKIASNTFYFIIAFAIVVILFKYTSVFEPEKKNVNENVNALIPININSGDLQNINTTTGKNYLDDYLKIKEIGKVLEVFEKRLISPQFTTHDQEKNNEIALEFLIKNSKKMKSSGKIDNGYLYLKAGAGSLGDLSTISSDESVFIYLGSTGGHLFMPNSLVNVPTEDGFTQYLFSLENIVFTNIPYSEENDSYSDNWLDRLNTDGEYYIGAFVSANRFSVIEEITIVYQGEGNLLIE